MSTDLKELYEFGSFRLDAAERCLIYKGELIPLTPKAFDTLHALVRRSGHVVSKEELLREVWPDAFVEEATVVQNIFTLRKALGRDEPDSTFIETVPKRGYRFTQRVIRLGDEGTTLLMERRTRTHVVTEEEEDERPPAGNGRHSPEVRADRSLSGVQALTRGGENGAELAHQISPAESPRPGFLRGRLTRHAWVIIPLILLSLLAVAGLLVVRYVKRERQADVAVASFERMSLAKFTRSGKAGNAVISSDGKYLAYVSTEAGQQSLRVRQVDTVNDAQLIPPAEVLYAGLTFSPDNNHIFYVTYEKAARIGVLYQIPIIGGAPKKVIEDVDSPVTFSPDRKRLAFVRGYPLTRETALVVANVDGGGEQRLATRAFPSFIAQLGSAWSPDGKVIACSVREDDEEGVYWSVYGIEAASGTEKRITAQRWAVVGRLAWTEDGGGLVMTAATLAPGLHQIWFLSYPGGAARRITNDLNDYRGVSLASGTNTLAATQRETITSLWLAPNAEADRAAQVQANDKDGLAGLTWTPDGRVIFTSNANGNLDLWIMNADGTGQRQLTSDERRDVTPILTPDGRYVIYSSTSGASTSHLWRVNIDGTDLRQLTFGNEDRFPQCSLDGKWVFYSAHDYDEHDVLREVIWKVSIDGGERVPVTDYVSSEPQLSPDGKFIACKFRTDQGSPWKLGVISVEGGAPIHELNLPEGNPDPLFRWSPDGTALTYVETRDGVSNIWSQRPGGGQPRQLTQFKSEQIFRYEWSRDGKQLLCVRGKVSSDAVLIKNFR